MRGIVSFARELSTGDLDSAGSAWSFSRPAGRTRRAPSERACGFQVSSSVRAGICARRAPVRGRRRVAAAAAAGGPLRRGRMLVGRAGRGLFGLAAGQIRFPGRLFLRQRRRPSILAAAAPPLGLLLAARSPAGPARVGAAEHDVESLRGARYTSQIALLCPDRAPRVSVLPQWKSGAALSTAFGGTTALDNARM